MTTDVNKWSITETAQLTALHSARQPGAEATEIRKGYLDKENTNV